MFTAMIFNLGIFFLFYRGREKLLTNILEFTFRFFISYVEPLFVVAKIIGLPGSSAVNNCNGRFRVYVKTIPTGESVSFPHLRQL